MSLNIPTLHKIEELKAENKEVKTFKFFSVEIAKESEPGQFVMVWNPGVDEIPISIAHASPEGELEVAIADVGDCSHSLHQKHVGDLIGLRGPYGRAFSLHGETICMVAGGYGAAPLRFAAKRAKEFDEHVVFLEGARSNAELLYIEEFERKGCEVRIATEDGSGGYKGLVTDLLEGLLSSGEKFEQVLTCGPELMMKRVCEITRRERIPTQVSVERIVKCGCGACGSCDLGGYRVCKDGPVFDAEELEKTEFGKWKREKSGKRIPIKPNVTANKRVEPLSIPPSHFKPKYEPLLATEVCGIEFLNPIMNAAGFGVSGKLLYRYAVAGAGAVVTKSVGLDEREGYPNPTFFEIAPHSYTYVNAMGLPNPGIKNYGLEIADAKYAEVPLVLSFFGKSVEECREVAKIAIKYPIDMLEFNASCPHTEFAAVEHNPKLLKSIIKEIRGIAHPKGIPIAVKISPNVGDPVGLALTAEKAGADAITAINTVISRPIDPTLDIPILGNPTGYGGKSGKELAFGGKGVVFALYEELRVPVIAVGGIFSTDDVIEYVKNGASLFQVGSVLVSEGFEIFPRLKRELKEYLVVNGYRDIGEMVGAAHRR
ncbi:MAG: dihydroorotate dehydrogenase electron transfer subunit [Methanophagales archaeon]|nr:dihydroorotate dehydrogenase electron transfer subunit [Methanophagales archaeon]MCW3141277.1 dihydroorotate dehydrogenase electron transfer subunit [Methanophagales archaeon]